MSKFNTKKPSNKTINLAGGIARKHSPEMELIVSVLDTFLEDKYYESGDERMERIRGLISQVSPEFVAKLCVVARTQFHLRSVSHLLLAELSRIHRGDNLVSKTLYRIAERPDDLIEIVAYLGHPIPKQVKKGIRSALRKFNQYDLAKYKNDNKKIKLVDLFNLVHPNPKSVEDGTSKAWNDLINGNLKNTETWEARLSSGEDKEKVWKDLIEEKKIGYMALLRNLRNISTQADVQTIAQACITISDPNRVRASKQLPFRFYNAYKNVSNQLMLNAISEAMEISLDNVPKLDGKTLISIDTSGSMEGDPIMKASIFASALMKSNDAEVILYSEEVRPFKFLNKEPIISIAERIQREAIGGGTRTSLTFDYAFDSGVKYDRIIILSDNESWVEKYGVQEIYNKYKETNDCFIYCIDIAGNGTKDISSEKTFHLAGWSEKIFDYIKWIEQSNGLVDIINSTEI